MILVKQGIKTIRIVRPKFFLIDFVSSVQNSLSNVEVLQIPNQEIFWREG